MNNMMLGGGPRWTNMGLTDMPELLYIGISAYLVAAGIVFNLFRLSTDNFKETDMVKVTLYTLLWPVLFVAVPFTISDDK